ncbi:MAG: DMT family transporter [Planctomycetaceae bacterium]
MSTNQQSPTHLPLGVGGGLFVLLLALLWGGTSVTARDAVDLVPPLAVGAIRFGLAALFMLGWCRWEGVSIGLKQQHLWPAFIMGVLLFLQIATFNWGVAWSNASHASLLVNTYIFWVAGWEHFVSHAMRLNRWQGLGLIVAAVGASLLMLETPAVPINGAPAAEDRVGPQDTVTLAGDLMLMLSAAILAAKVLYTKHAVRLVPSGTLILWHDIIGTGLFVVASAAFEFDRWPTSGWTPRVVLSLLYAGLVVSGFCFAGHAWMLRRHSASSVSVFSFATPVFGILLAVLLRGDILSGWLLLSGLLVAIGIVLVNASKSPE